MMAVIERDGKGNALLQIVRPDDWHLHVRTGEMLLAVLRYTARVFGRAIIMPNLKDAEVTTVAKAQKYREEILAMIPAGSGFDPLMTLYLTDNTSPDEVIRLKESGFVKAIKAYPAGATTNSDAGVTDLRKTYQALEEMQRLGVPLLVHGEVTDPAVDVFDREAVFIDQVLAQLVRDFPELKIVLEHITTKQGADFVRSAGPNVAATITAHHLAYGRNAMLVGGIRPHFYCLPILKSEEHRLALVKAATSGDQCFFLGTDSAPHLRHTKEAACGCAGCFTAPSALALYAEVFHVAKALDKFEVFASLSGPRFYGLPVNTDTITLVRDESDLWQLPKTIQVGDSGELVPFPQETNLFWRLG